MDSSTKTIIALFLLAAMFFAFNYMEFTPLNQGGNVYFQSLVFSTTSIISIFWGKFRIKLFYLAFFLLFLTTIIYLWGNIILANAVSSISVGMLLIISLTYLPRIIKEGTVDKL